MLQKVQDIPSQDFSGGLNTISDIFKLERNQSPNLMNVKVNFDGSIEKRLGTSTTNSVLLTGSANSQFTGGIAQSISNQLVAYWKLNEISGSRYDSYGSHILTDLNTVAYTDGRIGNAALFRRAQSEGLLIIDTSSLSTGDVDISWAGWIYLNSTNENTIFAKRDYDEKTILLLHGSGPNGSTTILDSSINNFSVAANSGAQISTALSRFNLSSLYFQGTSGFVSVSNNGIFNLAGSDNRWTWEGFVRFGLVDTTVRAGLFSLNLDTANRAGLFWNGSAQQLWFQVINSNTTNVDFRRLWAPQTGAFYHVALVRDGTAIQTWIDGTTLGTSTSSTATFPSIGSDMTIGRAVDSGNVFQYHSGWIDEARITMGKARYVTTGNFTAPSTEFTTQSQYEYWCYVNTDRIVTFRAASGGTLGLTYSHQVQANSFGALSTANWYHVVGWHDTANNFLGVSVNLSVNTAEILGGIRASSAPFTLGTLSNSTYAFMDGRIDEFGVWRRVLTTSERADLFNSGSGVTYSKGFDQYPWASFDFGATGTRWLTVAAGTGIYASSNLGVNFVTIYTAREAGYQYFERSKNILVGCSDVYDSPLVWSGSSGTSMFLLNNSAPLCKYAVNFQGFLILLNSRDRKRGFHYEDENTQLTGDWADSFDLPSSADDEITGAIVLRKKLYVSTRYKLFRVTFVGGNPDWSYLEIKDFGYVPRTIKKVSIKDIGEIVIGQSAERRIRLFDGADDRIISDNVENDNGMCDFALEKISYAGSGLTTSFAEFDPNDLVYKLCCTLGASSTQTTHFLNFDPRAQAFYPDSNRPFNTMTVAESGGRQYLMALDRSGFCHIVNSGNLDREKVAIDEVYDSALLFQKTPSQLSKSQRIEFYFDVTSSNNVYYYDRIDFSSIFERRETFKVLNTESVMQLVKSYDIPMFQNVYQYRITSSSGTSNSWRLNRADYLVSPAGMGRNQ